MSTYSSPNPTQQIGMMPPTPILAPFTSHQDPTITVTTAMLAGQMVANYGLGLPLQAPTSFFRHQQHHSPLGTVSSAPPNMLAFPHNVLPTALPPTDDDPTALAIRLVATSSYCRPTVMHTPVTTLGSGKASTARRSRTNNGATEHQYCCNSELVATERIAGAVGSSSAGGSAVGSSTRSAGLNGGVCSVLSTVAEDSDFCYEHVFSIHDRIDKQSLALRRPAASARAQLSTPSGSAAARGGSAKTAPFLPAPGLKSKAGARRTPSAATSLPCPEDGFSKMPLNTSDYGLNKKSKEFELFLASSTASGSSTSAGTPTLAASPADDVKPEATLSSKKRRRKDAMQTTKRRKLPVKAEGDAVKAEHDAQCSEHKLFSESSAIVWHLPAHTQERPYVCGHCGKRFSRNNDMKRHANIHTGERPYKCPICLHAFCRADGLARHTENGTTCKRAARALAWNRQANPPAAAQGTEPPL
ncbi:hypothetical protein GGI09_002415 [Coemansia sp. S100]|nr:hypothetical protein GGI09_002415 [Coemansia sp. S100]